MFFKGPRYRSPLLANERDSLAPDGLTTPGCFLRETDYPHGSCAEVELAGKRKREPHATVIKGCWTTKKKAENGSSIITYLYMSSSFIAALPW